MKAVKKLSRIIIIVLLVILSTTNVFASEPSKAYVVPIKGEINRATHNYVRDVVNDLNKMDVEAIIFEIDTYGGVVDEAIKIKDIILSTNIPTITFVNNKAASAGVLITIAGEHIVMAENAVIGSAETIPNTEKILSMWRGVLRDTAQFRGRDSLLIESMADSDIEIEGVITKGKLLNLTAKEAKELGLADILTSDYNVMLEEFGIAADSIEVIDEGLQVKLSKYVASPYISTILLTLGFVGLVIEILTPGFGLGGTISLMGFGLYFGGNILAGNSNWTSLVLFVVGLGLLVIEGIVPGFGLPGIGGIIFMLTGVALAMESLSAALLSLSIAIIITTLVAIVMVKLGFKSKLLGKIVLSSSEKDYLSTNTMTALMDLEGISLTELRPSGFIIIDSQKYDALAESGYIPENTPIKVVKVEGSKIFVRRNI
ncbi:MAG: NfeD family protein [Gudongella sp.]|nr:NfeD family protein [Gudongella sp.]